MNCKVFISLTILYYIIFTDIFAQNHKIQYSATPNHRELTIKAFRLAVNDGFEDINCSNQEIQDRLEAGSYSEDYETIPGIIGSHFPNPWSQGPDFDFFGLYPITKIPYEQLTDPSSGWSRGFMHGFDPVQRFLWPGASESTISWANSVYNSFTWNNAISLYNNGEWLKAYQCLGHVLHLLMDLSVPAHVKVVNHGGSLKTTNSGTLLDPDIAVLIIDEYETALDGGLELPNQPGINYIPNLLSDFRRALDSSKTANIPKFDTWHDYLDSLAKFTYYHPTVNQYYSAPNTNGTFGYSKDSSGLKVNPTKYVNTPPAEINGRWAQFEIYSTVQISIPVIPIIPKDSMIKMCRDLVPRAVEFAAGLIQHFNRQVISAIEKNRNFPETFILRQNHPNPFNPNTIISWQLAVGSDVEVSVYNLLGQKVATIVSEKLPAGYHEVKFNGQDLSSGVYFYKIEAGTWQDMRKMLLVK